MKPFATFLAAFGLAGAVHSVRAEVPGANLETFEKEIKPLIEKHCVQCHGPEKSKAELRLDRLDPDLFQGNDAEHWEEVYNQLNIGDMPPEDEEQPTPDEREIITAWLNDELRAAAAMKRSTGGSNVIRRLTRYEYNNTLRDPSGPFDYMRTIYDLMVLAFQTDSTRVATYQMASEEGSDVAATFPSAAGINKTSHAVSHARSDYEQWSTYNQFLTEQYAYFLKRLDSIEEADGSTLLDNTMTMLGCCTSQTHVSRNYPLIFSGGANLGIQHGHYRKYDEKKVPLSNLFVTMLDRMGTGVESFKDSNGALSELVRS